MTCKDCIRYEKCRDDRGETDYFDPTDDAYTAFKAEEMCVHFEDKALFAKKPRKGEK